jgi:hypothetical protein
MQFLRFFFSNTHFSNWLDKSPKPSHCLLAFDVNPGVPAEKQPAAAPSVFRAANDSEALENVAAFFQNNPRTVEKAYAIKIQLEDCKVAGIILQDSLGNTGVTRVDARHTDLLGTSGQFRKLVKHLIERIWEGEGRLCIFAAHALLGELAVLSRVTTGIDDAARVRCEQVLAKSPEMLVFRLPETVELIGKMKDAQSEEPLRASRRLD